VKAEGIMVTLSQDTLCLFLARYYIYVYRNILLQADVENNEDIREMKREILGGVQHVMNEVVNNINVSKILLIQLFNFV
jgi:hypothetical protein